MMRCIVADFDFSGLSPSQQALLTFCGWDRQCGRPKPRKATVQPMIARGLVVLHPQRAGGTDPARYEVPIAVHAAWCAHCAGVHGTLPCFYDRTGLGEPGVSCGDCPTRDYKRADGQPQEGKTHD